MDKPKEPYPSIKSMLYDEIQYGGLIDQHSIIIQLSILIIIIMLLFYVIPEYSVYYKYVGKWDNNTIWDEAYKSCGNNKFIDRSECCNQIGVYCERFAYPLHRYTINGASEDYTVVKWFWEY